MQTAPIIYPVIDSDLNLPFFLTGIGIDVPEYHVERPLGLVSHQFLITLEGKGELLVNGSSYPLEKNCLLYLSPGLSHTYTAKTACWKTAWIVFRGNDIDDSMRHLGFPSFFTRPLNNLPTILHVFKQIHTAATDPINGRDTASCLIYELILRVRKDTDNSPPSASAKELLEKAVTYIDDHYKDDITLENIANWTNISCQHLCRIFKSYLHMRPIQYVTRRRISEAKMLLLHTDKHITQIAFEVGYKSSTYFGMVFKKLEGISPKEFRSNDINL